MYQIFFQKYIFTEIVKDYLSYLKHIFINLYFEFTYLFVSHLYF